MARLDSDLSLCYWPPAREGSRNRARRLEARSRHRRGDGDARLSRRLWQGIGDQGSRWPRRDTQRDRAACGDGAQIGRASSSLRVGACWISSPAGRPGEARERAYRAVDRIGWPEGFCRRDIGGRGLSRTYFRPQTTNTPRKFERPVNSLIDTQPRYWVLTRGARGPISGAHRPPEYRAVLNEELRCSSRPRRRRTRIR